MKKKYIYLIIVVVSMISIFPILVKSNVWGHDTNFHLANIEDITNNISFTNLLPKISPNIGNGLGYGTHLFYAPLPHYIGGYINLIFRLLNLGVDNCLVFIYLIISILSGIVVYQYSYELFKKQHIALISSIIFLLMPYRMGDMIVRSSLNEVFVFLFIPMILLSLNRLIHNQNYFWWFVIGYTGLILSHFVMALYTTLFLGIWAIIFHKKLLKQDIIINLFKGVLLVAVWVLPFLILVLSQKLDTDYLIFLDGYMSNIDYMNFYSLSIKDFLIPLNNYSWEVPQFINILVLVSFIVSIFFFFYRKNKRKNPKKDENILYLFILFIICFIMCLKIFPWEMVPNTLYMIQFPWRLQTFITISVSIIAPLWLDKLDSKKTKHVTIIFICLLVISQIPFIKSMMNYDFLLEEKLNYNYGMGHSKEYLPVSSYEKIDYFDNRNNEIKCYDCSSTIKKSDSKNFVFELRTTEEQVIELPRIYYVGYTLKNSNNENVKFYENENGFIEFVGNTGHYILMYKAPKIYKLAIFLSSLTTLSIITYYGYSILKKKSII